MKVQWNCGMFVGPSSWRFSGDWVFEPDECPGEGEFEVTVGEWNELNFPTECTECGQELDPFCAHFIAEDGETSYDVYSRIFTGGEGSKRAPRE